MSIKLPFLYFKGINSLDLNLYIKSKGSYNAPARDVTYTSVPGRNGDLITDNGRYLNVNIPYEFTLIKKDIRMFEELISSVKAWLLSETGYFPLWDSYDPRYFRYASYNGGIEPLEELRGIGEFTATFNCKPLRYSFDGQKTITISSAETIINPEAFKAKPYIKIYGNGNIYLFINNNAFGFKNVSEYIEIDSEILNAYKGSELQNLKMTSVDFPTFFPGKNNISFVGDVSKIEIIPRWCSL